MEKKYKSVLLIDDREVDNIIHSERIKAANFAEVVYKSNSADSALEFLHNIALISTDKDNKLPEFIFVDLDMPVMDGVQFLAQFSELNDSIKKHCKVVMLSATDNSNDVASAKKNPYLFKFLKKPLKPEDLKLL